MNRKRGIALLCSLTLVGNQLPLSYISVLADGEQPTEITLPSELINPDIVKSKEYDGTTEAIVKSYTDDDVDAETAVVDFSGIDLEVDGDVHLDADAEFLYADVVEENQIILSNFKLIGDNAAQYSLKLEGFENDDSLTISATIEPRTIWLTPDENASISENETTPKRIEYTYDGILESDVDSIDVQSKLWIDKDENGDYIYRLEDAENTGSENYVAAIDPDLAPKLVDVDASSFTITDAFVSEVDGTTVLKQYDFGVVANGNVYVDITAESEKSYDSVTFTFADQEFEVKDPPKKESEDPSQDEPTIYQYKARFELSCEDGQSSADFSNATCTINNGTESDPLAVKYHIKDNDEVKSLVIDGNHPTVNDDMKVEYDDQNKKLNVTGTIVDAESGIQSIQYKWDFQSDWVDYTVPDSNPNRPINFEIETSYPIDNENGQYELKFKITDNAGNTRSESGIYCDESQGRDTKPPKITYINLDKTNDSAWDTIIHFLSFGNFANQELKLSFKAEDEAESEKIQGIKKIEIIDNADSDNPLQIIEGDDIKDSDHIYEFTFSPDQTIEDWCIRLTDKGGTLSEPYVIKDLLQDEELTQEESSTDTTTEAESESTETITTTDSVDWNEAESNRWIFDNTPPTCDVVWGSAVVQNGIHYYNNNGGEFQIRITDNSSLFSWTVTPIYRANPSDKGTKQESQSKTYSEEISEDTYSLDTSKLETGWYSFQLTAIDNAKNELTKESVATFYVDHEVPGVRIEVVSPELEGFTTTENWIKEKTDGEINPITVRLYVDTPGAEMESVHASINEGAENLDFTKSALKTDGNYVEFTIGKSNPNGLSYKDDHTYSITAEIETESGNSGSADPYTLHVDTEVPTVDQFVVERSNTAAEGILNVLTFGVFANDSLTLTVTVSDHEYDSGVDYVEIQHDGLSTAQKMKSIGNGQYTFELPLQTDIFQSEITVTVYDKTGKVNTSCPDIQNTTGDKSTRDNHFAMIETVAPTLTVELPATDSVARSDGQIWYRQHTNTEKGVEPADAEKTIRVSVQDENSGLRYVQMLINGSDISGNSADYELNQAALPTIASTEAGSNKITKGLQFEYSIEKIAEWIPANADGSYIIEFRVVDNAGNVTTVPLNSKGESYKDGKVVYYRDTIAPIITEFSFNPTTEDEITNTSDFIESLEYGFYFKRDFEATVTVNDAVPSSGYHQVVFKLIPYSNGSMQEEEEYTVGISSGNQATYTVRAGFKGQIYATAYDNVMNESESETPQAFVSDETAPVITIEALPDNASGTDGNGNKLYTSSVSFRVTISDTESGLRSISYSKSSENDSFADVVTEIDNYDGFNSDSLANGWQIDATDANLITEVSQVFTFDSDDNDISLTFNATDRSKNSSEPETSEAFTIDTIAPQVSISNSSTPVNEMYYPGSTTFVITVIERNFDEALMIRNIENTFGNTIPSIQFTDSDLNTHTATVVFGEGDFTFSLSGTDRGGHSASITFNGESQDQYFFTTFNVDATPPSIKTNFSTFGQDDDAEIYYNAKQEAEAVITITEHNFNSEDVGLVIEQKAAGSSHSNDGWSIMSYYPEWKDGSNSDVHTTSILLDNDSVYRIYLKPIDRAMNEGVFEEGSPDHTPVFEVDKTAPTFEGHSDVSADSKNMSDTSFYVVYAESDKLADAPTVSFDDTNFDRIEYTYSICTPQYTNGYELTSIAPNTNGKKIPSVSSKTFQLTTVQSNWKSEKQNTAKDAYKEIPDGVYAMTYTAVDKAGNKSETIHASYFRMVNTDVLAYIYNSEKGKDGARVGTGFYSLMDEDGIALSKKATNFQDLDILVIKPIKDTTAGNLVLREDEKEYALEDYADFTVDRSEKVSDTAVLQKMHIPGSYFSETFKDDGLDTRMELSVSVRDDVYQWLGSIHIDNEIPTAIVPSDFKNWHNYFFEKETTITLTNVSEPLDDTLSIVYECPRNGERTPLPHVYDAENNTYSFTLLRGVHHIDITLVDEAGNEWNVDRVRYVRVGNFRLYVGGGAVAALAATAFIVWRKKRRA